MFIKLFPKYIIYLIMDWLKPYFINELHQKWWKQLHFSKILQNNSTNNVKVPERNVIETIAFKNKNDHRQSSCAFRVCHVLSYLSRLINAFAFTVLELIISECITGCVLFTNSVVDGVIILQKLKINRSHCYLCVRQCNSNFNNFRIVR